MSHEQAGLSAPKQHKVHFVFCDYMSIPYIYDHYEFFTGTYLKHK